MAQLAAIFPGPYSLFYSLAVIAAATSMYLAGSRRGWPSGAWAAAVLAWAVSGMAGALLPRLLLGDAVAYRTIVGAIAVSSLCLVVLARALRRDTADVLDTTAVAIPIGAAIVRVGCFFAECCQGIATSLPIGVALHPDDTPRHPVQLYESVLEGALAVVIARRGNWSDPGRKFATSLAGMCAIRFVTELVRDNEKYAGLSLAQWVVLPVGALCVAHILSRSVVGRMAPAGLAVLALQMPVVRPDSAPQQFTFMGGGFNFGRFDTEHHWGDCEGGNESWTRHHTYTGVSLEGGGRNVKSATRSTTFRGRGYANIDEADAAIVKSGSPPSKPGPYTRHSAGIQVAGDFDWKYFGLTLGASVGQFYMAWADDNYGSTHDNAAYTQIFMPALGFRLGPQRGISIDLRAGDESPMWAPAPAASTTLVFGDGRGNGLRIGPADGGLIVSGRQMNRNGLEILPMVLLPDGSGKSLHAGVAFRKWVKAAPPTPDDR